MYHKIPEDLRVLIEPVVADYQLELVDAEVSSSARAPKVRVIVDTPEGDGRVPIDRCAQVSREIGTCLDAQSEFPADYQLEVASPGLDRVLARPKDFGAACGREIKVETGELVAGRRHFRGQLQTFDGKSLLVAVDGNSVEIPFSAVKRANQVYEFSSSDFASASAGRGRRRRDARRNRAGGKA